MNQTEFLLQLQALQDRFKKGQRLSVEEKTLLLTALLLGQATRQEQKYDHV